MENKFDHNAIGIVNGNYFALPYSAEESALVLLPVPWDATTSYNDGTSLGPQAILDASAQVDLFDYHVEKAWENKIGTAQQSSFIAELNSRTRKKAKEVINLLSQGAAPETDNIKKLTDEVNSASEEINKFVYEETKKLISQGKTVGVIGGEHSVPLGFLKALSETHSKFGILQIDAHADLRNSYEGFEFSHASIMYNALKIENVVRLVQVGIRDICEEEYNLAAESERIVLFDDYRLKADEFEGKKWKDECKKIIETLPSDVYISFDIDGLSPELCPNTGTPVPGGLSYHQVIYLIASIVKSGRKIVGFDLCEVAPGKNSEWDANVGARILYKLAQLCIQSNDINK